VSHSGPKHLRMPSWAPLASLVALVLSATATGLRNTFVQDDLPIIKMNALVHTLRIWPLFTQAYWPAPYPRELYRPLTSAMLAVEWVIGGGHPIAFRIASILLYLGATLAVYGLAKRLLSPGAAWLAAALFAVHPVHVEAVAVAVNQAELVVGALIALLMTAYIDRRRASNTLTPGWIAGMTAGFVVAALFKEHALLLPALMVAAELTVIPDRRPWRERVATLRLFFLLMVLMAVSLVAVRGMALHGDTKGSFTAEALLNLTIFGRARTMLGVVPEWFRLFLWPEHLRADYSPQEIVAAVHWGSAQTAGAVLLLITAWIAWAVRRARPQMSFGILWTAVGLILVSNLVVTTGIVLAERTLFLATIGVVIAGADALWPIAARLYARGSTGRIAVTTGVVLLLGMGATRSASRQRVWRDLATLWYQSIIDAPKSYRAQQAYGSVLFQVGMEHSAELRYQRAMTLFPKAWPLYLDLADKLRERGKCEPALHYYREVLLLTPSQSGPRASEVACLVYLGYYTKAASEARLGAGYGVQTGTFGLYAHIADSAARVHAPPRTVVLPPPIDAPSAP
jgi:hypothetical protein